MWSGAERRQRPGGGSTGGKALATAGVGVPLAVLLAWGFELQGVFMPSAVQFAAGAVIGALCSCFNEFITYLMRVGVLIVRRRTR